MKVLVIGAAGKTGRAVVNRCLKAGHQVTAFVHHSNPFLNDAEITVIKGDATEKSIMDTAVKAKDAVIYTMGGKAPYKSSTVETDAMQNIVTAMEMNGVHQLLVVSMLGLGQSGKFASTFSKIFYSTFLHGAKKDKTDMERCVKQSSLDWTIVRPPRLTEEEAIGNVKIFQTKKDGNAHRISRKDLTNFLVDQLGNNTYKDRALTLATS